MSGVACISCWPTTTRWAWLRMPPAGRYGSRTEAVASLAWRISGSCSSRPCSTTMKQRVPTLPTPTTLRAKSTKRYRSRKVTPVLGHRGPVSVKMLEDRLGAVEVDSRDHRRILEDDPPSVDDPGERLEGAHAVAPPGLREDRLETAPAGCPSRPASRPAASVASRMSASVIWATRRRGGASRRTGPSTGGSCARWSWSSGGSAPR